MLFQRDIDVHFWLTRGLARRLGINITEAMRSGVLTRADFAAMVARCRDCEAGVQACIGYLSEAPSAPDTAPECCANRAVLETLRDLA